MPPFRSLLTGILRKKAPRCHPPSHPETRKPTSRDSRGAHRGPEKMRQAFRPPIRTSASEMKNLRQGLRNRLKKHALSLGDAQRPDLSKQTGRFFIYHRMRNRDRPHRHVSVVKISEQVSAVLRVNHVRL